MWGFAVEVLHCFPAGTRCILKSLFFSSHSQLWFATLPDLPGFTSDSGLIYLDFLSAHFYDGCTGSTAAPSPICCLPLLYDVTRTCLQVSN